jgi:hypothetical protein
LDEIKSGQREVPADERDLRETNVLINLRYNKHLTREERVQYLVLASEYRSLQTVKLPVDLHRYPERIGVWFFLRSRPDQPSCPGRDGRVEPKVEAIPR